MQRGAGKIQKRGGSALGQRYRPVKAVGDKGSRHGSTLNPVLKDPAFVILTGWCLSLFLCAAGAPLWCAASAGVLFCAFLGLAGSSGSIAPGFWGVFIFLLMAAAAGSFLLMNRLDAGSPLKERVSITGKVSSERSWGRGRVVLLDAREGRYVVHLPPSALFRDGDQIRVAGVMESLDPHPGGTGFDEGTYWKARGADGIFRHASAEHAGEMSLGFHGWRGLLKERVLKELPPMMRGHILAAWLGTRDPELALRHSSWGTSHLLAVSGLHVGMVVFLLFIFLPVRFPRFSISSSAMWFYVFVAGASASALRASLMLQTGFTGRWIGRPIVAVNTVSVAGLMLLLWRPWFFWDLGWRLSMIAALLLASLHDLGTKKGWFLAPVLLWVSTAGLVSEAFGTVPVAGMVINFIAVPLFGFLLPAASLLAIPALARIPGGWLPASVGEFLFSAWAVFADAVTRVLPWELSFSWVLSLSGALAAGFLILRAIGFRHIPAAIFAGSIALLFVNL